MTFRSWPQPSPIPWSDIQLEDWGQAFTPAPLPESLSSDDFLANWCAHWENSLDGFCTTSEDHALPRHCKSRAQRRQPMTVTASPPVAKPSRSGEIQLRCDFTSTVLLKWYKQLRRLQSYSHAATAGKTTVNAEHYRLSLWLAIKRADGFEVNFSSWWTKRLHPSPAAPSVLPQAPPTALMARAIFEDFQVQFRHFETWVIRQRTALLQTKYDKTCKALFHELREPSRDQLDLLWSSEDLTVLAVDSASHSLHLDATPKVSTHSVWKWNSCPLDFLRADDDVLTFQQLPAGIEPGDCIQHQVVFSAVDDIHAALQDLWRSRWQQLCSVDDATWARIMGFIQAYMPTRCFEGPSFTLSSWHNTLKRSPAHAARGVDGIAAKDLQQLPAAATQQLLDFLSSLDGIQCPWPTQLRYGTVISLAKINEAHLANHFRPVVIFGTIYRAWSRLCDRPLLQQLNQCLPETALGFLPGRECAQIWVQIQAFIELSCRDHLALHGFSADVEKCFNNIGRGPLRALAKHVGFPAAILDPWFAFLSSCTRAFVVRTAHSTTLDSNHGLPEGCAMSVVGMILVDWALHVYMQVLAPSIHLFSYVDNISVAAHDPLQVVSAYMSMVCFFQLWGLTLDASKTFCWGTHSHGRATLRLLGFPLSMDAQELGGSMTYGRGRRNRHLKARGSALAAKWQRLKRSRCPQQQKLAVIPLVFWASALHGCASCPVSAGYIHELRQQALKALTLRQAGSNGILRLSLSGTMTADPGFYQVLSTLQVFCRMCWKTARILACWQRWWALHDGQVSHGPSGQVLLMLSELNWFLLAPPLVQDHTGMVHDLLLLDRGLLRFLLEEAWLQHVAAVACTRPSMTSAHGLDHFVNLEHNQKLTPQERGLQNALQSGCFIDKWTHGKFDVTASRICSVCLVPCTHEHYLVCGKFAHLRQKHGLSSSELLTWPKPFSLHLQCPRSPFVDQLRRYFAELPDLSGEFESGPSQDAIQHLFTDGSCFASGRRDVHQAAWAVYHAGTQMVVAGGPLPGILQNVARAELMAVIAALRWMMHFGCRTHLWIDAQHIYDGLLFRLRGGTTAFGVRNSDMWFVVDQLLDDGGRRLLTASWIPSHLCPELCESPMEEWIALNNDKVDSLAVNQNASRPLWFQQLVLSQLTWDEEWVQRMKSLRSYYFDVFELTKQVTPVSAVISVDSSDEEGTLYSFSHFLSVDPHGFDIPSEDLIGFPLEFVQKILCWICNHEQPSRPVHPFSLLELTVGLCSVGAIHWPHRNPMTGVWEWYHQHTQFDRPTLSFHYSLIRKVMRVVFDHCCFSSPACQGINRSSLGITMPLEGFYVALNPATLASIATILQRFTATRPIRRSADMARPL